jgi:hypothetical protein
MYERKPEYDKAIERLWMVLEGLNRNDVLEHKVAAAALGVPYGEGLYYGLISRIKRKMEDQRGITLESAPLVGYLLCDPNAQLAMYRKRSTQAARRIHKGYRHISCLPDHECNFVQLRAKNAMMERAVREERNLRGQAQWISFILRPRDDRPPRVVGDVG